MKKEDILLVLNECLSTEEIPVILPLDELEDLIQDAKLNSNIRKKLIESIHHLKKDTTKHAKIFSGLIGEVVKSNKNEY